MFIAYSDLMDGRPPYGFVFLLEIHANHGCMVGIEIFFFFLRKKVRKMGERIFCKQRNKL